MIMSWLQYVTCIVCYKKKGGVNIGGGNELVWLCRVGDDYGYDMVVEGKVG